MREGIKIREISYHLPIDIVMSGLSGCIDSLVNACAQDRNDRRLQMEHEARMVTQSMQTIKESINVQEKLNEQIWVECLGRVDLIELNYVFRKNNLYWRE